MRSSLTLDVTLNGRNHKATIKALLDSGASSIFLHPRFVRHHHVTTRRLAVPIPLHNADNSLNAIGRVTEAAELGMQIQDHRETITAYVADTREDDMITGN